MMRSIANRFASGAGILGVLWLGFALAAAQAQLPKGPPPAKPTLEEELWAAVAEDDVKRAEELLLSGANPNARREADGWTPLILCVKEDKMGMAAVLLRLRADPNLLSTDAYKNTALLFSLEKRKEALPWVQMLLAAGADPNLGPGTKNYTPLMKAVSVNELELVEALLAAGADVMAVDPQGGTALSRAIGMGNPPIVKLLKLETQKKLPQQRKPLRLSARDQALLEALEAGHEAAALELLSGKETDPNARGPAGLTPIMLAARGGLAQAAARLIHLGANIDTASRDANPQPVIFFALGSPERLPVLLQLLEAGADPNAKRAGDSCPVLLEAVRVGSPAAVAALLTEGARPGDRDKKGRSAWQEVMAGEDEQLKKLFRLYGDDRLLADATGTPASLDEAQLSLAELAQLAGGQPASQPTASQTDNVAKLVEGAAGAETGKHRLELHLAVAQEDIAQVRSLLADGADPNSYDRRGRTPLMTAADLVNADLCRALIKAGADVTKHSKDEFRSPAIIYAVSRRNSEETLLVLLEAGSPVDARLADWLFTPLILSTMLENRANVELLLARGADPKLRDRDGRTALDVAKKTNNTEITALLEAALAKMKK